MEYLLSIALKQCIKSIQVKFILGDVFSLDSLHKTATVHCGVPVINLLSVTDNFNYCFISFVLQRTMKWKITSS